MTKNYLKYNDNNDYRQITKRHTDVHVQAHKSMNSKFDYLHLEERKEERVFDMYLG